MTILVWTRSPLPMEPGRYWVQAETKKNALGEPAYRQIVQVIRNRSDFGETWHSVYPNPAEWFTPYVWAGPILPPTESAP